MKRLTIAIVLAAVTGCNDSTAPPTASFVLQVVSPAALDALHDADSVVFVGEASAADLGPLPNDSLWWTQSDSTIGRGQVLRTMVRSGAPAYVFRARYGSQEAADTVQLKISPTGVGRVLWSVPLDSGAIGLSLAPSGLLYAADNGGTTAVAIGLDGSLLWRAGLGLHTNGTAPAVADDGTSYWAYAESNPVDGGVVAVRPNGEIAWTLRTSDHAPAGKRDYRVYGGPAIGRDGTIYFASAESDRPVYAVASDGTLLWRTATDSDTFTGELHGYTTLVGDSLVVAVAPDTIVAVSTQTGAVRWETSLSAAPNLQYAPAIGSNDSIYVLGTVDNQYTTSTALLQFAGDGHLQTQRVLSVQVSPAGAPVFTAPGYLYLGTGGGVAIFNLQGASVYGCGPSRLGAPTAVTLGQNRVSYSLGADTLYSYDYLCNVRFKTPIPNTLGADPGSGPIIGPDGNVYVRATSGVYAIRDTVGVDTAAGWPAVQGGFRRLGRRN